MSATARLSQSRSLVSGAGVFRASELDLWASLSHCLLFSRRPLLKRSGWGERGSGKECQHVQRSNCEHVHCLHSKLDGHKNYVKIRKFVKDKAFT